MARSAGGGPRHSFAHVRSGSPEGLTPRSAGPQRLRGNSGRVYSAAAGSGDGVAPRSLHFALILGVWGLRFDHKAPIL